MNHIRIFEITAVSIDSANVDEALMDALQMSIDKGCQVTLLHNSSAYVVDTKKIIGDIYDNVHRPEMPAA